MRQTERDIPEKLRPVQGPALVRAGREFGRLAPECHLVSNGSWSVLACDNGLTASRMGDCQITLAKLGQYYAPAGISLFFQGREGIFGLTRPLCTRRENIAGSFTAPEPPGLLPGKDWPPGPPWPSPGEKTGSCVE